MAAGETSGQSGPRRLVTAGGGRRRAELGEPGSAPSDEAVDQVSAPDDATDTDTDVEAPTAAPLPGTTPAKPDDLERLLAEEEEIERRTRNEHHETPHFRKESD